MQHFLSRALRALSMPMKRKRPTSIFQFRASPTLASNVVKAVLHVVKRTNEMLSLFFDQQTTGSIRRSEDRSSGSQEERLQGQERAVESTRVFSWMRSRT